MNPQFFNASIYVGLNIAGEERTFRRNRFGWWWVAYSARKVADNSGRNYFGVVAWLVGNN